MNKKLEYFEVNSMRTERIYIVSDTDNLKLTSSI